MDKNFIVEFLKNKNNQRIILIIIIGLVFALFLGGESKDKTPARIEKPSEEERLEKILSDIEGCGDVSVMITYYGTDEKNIAYEKSQNTASGGGGESYDEKAVITDDGPLVINESFARVRGVIATADGADSAKVQENLINAVSAALDVPKHKICVYKKRR